MNSLTGISNRSGPLDLTVHGVLARSSGGVGLYHVRRLCPTRKRRNVLNYITTADRVRKPYFLSFSFSFASAFASAFPSATAWAFAPRISARNGWAADGAGTLPNSKARVVTLRP